MVEPAQPRTTVSPWPTPKSSILKARLAAGQAAADDPLSGLSAANRAWIEDLYASWLESPSSVSRSWAELFAQLGDGLATSAEAIRGPEPDTRSIFAAGAPEPVTGDAAHIRKNASVLDLITAYRRNGHLVATLDPLGLHQRPLPPELTLQYWGLTEDDLDTVFETGRLAGPAHATLRDIIDRCQAIYTGTFAAEFMYIRDEERRRWIERRIEESGARIALDRPTGLRVLDKLTAADHFESFVHTKYLGAKRFSVEGAEALIPLLDLMVSTAGDMGVGEIVIGMAHRGRLNVLANLLGKASQDIFEEFEDHFPRPAQMGGGDVKYHLGYSSDVETPDGKKLHLRLAFNPSHLEFVNPVVEGMVRGKQDHFGDTARHRTVPVLIHGDAAVIGQGVVSETLNLAGLPGYDAGGTIHIVVNNQIGFTTTPDEGRTPAHCTDGMKVILPPVLHVDADDFGAVAFAARLAAEYRQTFHKDFVIDLVCYRKYGHNEGDEPAFTQPLMYQAIRARKTPLKRFIDRYTAEGVLTDDDVADADARVRTQLETALRRARAKDRGAKELAGLWKGLRSGTDPTASDYPTEVEAPVLQEIARHLATAPEGMEVHPKVQRILDYRAELAEGKARVDWSMGESLAYGSLLREGYPVRLAGQDSGRGTFSHRHAVIYDQKTGEAYLALKHLTRSQAQIDVINSPLSEVAALGFEYGYTLSRPEALVIWEAQFGDFANGAQVIIDQFISSSEAKWNRHTGVVLFLPHGYEGMGPEHSSARIERFLQLSAEDNWRVLNPSTPAQVFHALRSQLHRNYRKPLVVFTPKSLLRLADSFAGLDELVHGSLKPVIDDAAADPETVKRVVLCSGKVYYDLMSHLKAHPAPVAVVRVEQLYPFDAEEAQAVIHRYPHAREVVWCQEEPANMGAWLHLEPLLRQITQLPILYAGRVRAASPATGSKFLHDQEQEALIRSATNIQG